MADEEEGEACGSLECMPSAGGGRVVSNGPSSDNAAMLEIKVDDSSRGRGEPCIGVPTEINDSDRGESCWVAPAVVGAEAGVEVADTDESPPAPDELVNSGGLPRRRLDSRALVVGAV